MCGVKAPRKLNWKLKRFSLHTLRRSRTNEIFSCFLLSLSQVYVCPSLANLYESIGKNDWRLKFTGVPVLLHDKGSARSRAVPRVTYILAERGSCFALWQDRIDNLSDYRVAGPAFHTMCLSTGEFSIELWRFIDHITSHDIRFPNLQIIPKWLVSVLIRIRRPVTFGRALNDWLVIRRIFRWVCRDEKGNKANDQSRFHCHRNHKFRSRANSRMWPASPRTIHSDTLACKHLWGIRSTIESHEPFVSTRTFFHTLLSDFVLMFPIVSPFRWPMECIRFRITTIFVNRN